MIVYKYYYVYLFLARPDRIDAVAHASNDRLLAVNRYATRSLLLLDLQRWRVTCWRHVHRCGCGCGCGGCGGVQSELFEGGGSGLRSVVRTTSGPLQPSNGDGLHDSTGWV